MTITGSEHRAVGALDYLNTTADHLRLEAVAEALPLQLQSVGKTWRKAPHPILDGLDFTLPSGRRAWVGGQNGVGKTTMLRIAAGLINPDCGSVRAYGLSPVRDRRAFYRRVRLLSAGNTGIYARITVREQIDCWARIALLPRDERARAVEDTIDRFRLQELAGHRSDRLSMGQRQRLRIAMAFIGDPDVVLLDEPLNSLDLEGAAILTNAVNATALRGGAVLWVSPTFETIDAEFDDRYILERGRLHQV